MTNFFSWNRIKYQPKFLKITPSASWPTPPQPVLHKDGRTIIHGGHVHQIAHLWLGYWLTTIGETNWRIEFQ